MATQQEYVKLTDPGVRWPLILGWHDLNQELNHTPWAAPLWEMVPHVSNWYSCVCMIVSGTVGAVAWIRVCHHATHNIEEDVEDQAFELE